MKTLIICLLATFTLSASFAQKTQDSAIVHKTVSSKVSYHCEMHPDQVSNKPGKCPVCGMDLVKVKMKTKIKNEKISSKVKA